MLPTSRERQRRAGEARRWRSGLVGHSVSASYGSYRGTTMTVDCHIIMGTGFSSSSVNGCGSQPMRTGTS
jgi:hypothetical protein